MLGKFFGSENGSDSEIYEENLDFDVLVDNYPVVNDTEEEDKLDEVE